MEEIQMIYMYEFELTHDYGKDIIEMNHSSDDITVVKKAFCDFFHCPLKSVKFISKRPLGIDK